MIDEAQALSSGPECDPAVEAAQGFAQAEWRMWSTFLDLVERDEATIEASDHHPLLRLAQLSFIPNDLGQRVHWSEGQICHVVAKARRLRDHTPAVWQAFSEGRIDGPKAREISSAVDKLERAESIKRLDQQVLAYAETHTLAETRRWLKRFIARVEADLFNERAERALADRAVNVVHGDDGVSWLMVQHASHVIAAVDKRLTKEAKAFGADDPRNLQQRRADLFAAWTTTNEAREAAVNADIAVTIPGSAIAGADASPAVAADGGWVVPAEWMLELTKYDGNSIFWHRMILDPVTDDVLAHEYKGRFAPEVLAKAIEFRDGVCQAPGCCRPASLCDIDHRIPHHDGGPTAAWNLGPYCRHNHIQKGFGLLDTGPTSKSPPGRSRNAPLHSVGAHEIITSPMERKAQHVLIDWIHCEAA